MSKLAEVPEVLPSGSRQHALTRKCIPADQGRLGRELASYAKP
jgi:hypothetical protein